MSTIRKLDPSHRLERNRRREALASIMLASPHTRLGAARSATLQGLSFTWA